MMDRARSVGSTNVRIAVDVGTRRFAFVMEQTLGHVTHYQNLRAAIEAEPGVEATWYPLSFPPRDKMERLPLLRSNWSARASWRARHVLARDGAVHTHDAFFFHTQVATLLSTPLLRRVPAVISLDATPINYDTVGAAYGHRPSGSALESLKRRLNTRSLHAAGALVTWCDWARRSLIQDYGIPSERITVIPPGVNLSLWPQPAPRADTGPVRLLFVGGDFERKGGRILREAFAGLSDRCELHIVTKEPVETAPNQFVYHDVAPNSELLRDLYATADIFVLPTIADCFPLVIQEAMAAGLPVVATDVGAIGEAVRSGETGLLVPVSDPRALRAALEYLAHDHGVRRRMSTGSRVVAEREFNSAVNASHILDIMRGIAHGGRGHPIATRDRDGATQR